MNEAASNHVPAVEGAIGKSRIWSMTGTVAAPVVKKESIPRIGLRRALAASMKANASTGESKGAVLASTRHDAINGMLSSMLLRPGDRTQPQCVVQATGMAGSTCHARGRNEAVSA